MFKANMVTYLSSKKWTTTYPSMDMKEKKKEKAGSASQETKL